MSTRKGIKEADQVALLTRCRRRCCLCYGLKKDTEIKRGQIAHVDQDPSNNKLENLAWLCLDHHDEYDSKTSQSKKLKKGEVTHYKKELELLYAAEAKIPIETVNFSSFDNNDDLSRAEVIKTAIELIDGLVTYKKPDVPTFEDVRVDEWYYDYIESAVQLGIVMGCADDDGNLTGIFSPNDLATSKWVVKVFLNSFGFLPLVSD